MQDGMEDTYTFFSQKVKGEGHDWTLSTLWFWHDHVTSYQSTAFILSISYIDAGWREEDTYTFSGQTGKGQGHNWTLSTL